MRHAEIVASTAATERRCTIVEDGVLWLGPVVGQSMFVSRGAGREISSSSVHHEYPALRQVSYSRRIAAGGGLGAYSA